MRPANKRRGGHIPACGGQLCFRIAQRFGRLKKRRIGRKDHRYIRPFSSRRTVGHLRANLLGQFGNLFRSAVGLLKFGQQPAEPLGQSRLTGGLVIQTQIFGLLQQNAVCDHLPTQSRQFRACSQTPIEPEYQPIERQHPQSAKPLHTRLSQHYLFI